MHATEREALILDCLERRGFVSFQELEKRLAASPATIRRDLDRLATVGRLTRVHGGAKLNRPAADDQASQSPSGTQSLLGVPFQENINRHLPEKRAIGLAAARLCAKGDSVVIDGGSTTLQMCPHLAGLQLQVLTNSLPIISALLPQSDTRIVVPSGQIFREQDIILSMGGEDDGLPHFHAPTLFMGAAAIGPVGLMQADPILASIERRLAQRSDRTIVLVDSSKFNDASGHVVCGLQDIDVIVTDEGIRPEHVALIEGANIQLVIAPLL